MSKETTNAIKKFIKITNNESKFSSLFLQRLELYPIIEKQVEEMKKQVTRKKTREDDYIFAIYLLLSGYHIHDHYSRICKHNLYKYFKQLTNVFDIDMRHVCEILFKLYPQYNIDKKIIDITDNFSKTKTTVLQNLYQVEKKINQKNLFLNDSYTDDIIYSIIKDSLAATKPQRQLAIMPPAETQERKRRKPTETMEDSSSTKLKRKILDNDNIDINDDDDPNKKIKKQSE